MSIEIQASIALFGLTAANVLISAKALKRFRGALLGLARGDSVHTTV